ncbi:MAG: hypothetical protein U0744_07975 [Gemmataceae bacterium]
MIPKPALILKGRRITINYGRIDRWTIAVRDGEEGEPKRNGKSKKV